MIVFRFNSVILTEKKVKGKIMLPLRVKNKGKITSLWCQFQVTFTQISISKLG